MILLFHNFLHFAKLLNKKYGTHIESRILHLHKIFYSAAKEGSQTVRYEISDMFLRFWFRYFVKYQNLIELQNYTLLGDIIKKDFPTYSGITLEMYFRKKMMESHEFIDIGSWWSGKNNSNQNEIDIIGIYADNKRALVAEVKRKGREFKPEHFKQKIDFIRTKILSNYEIESCCLSMNDM